MVIVSHKLTPIEEAIAAADEAIRMEAKAAFSKDDTVIMESRTKMEGNVVARAACNYDPDDLAAAFFARQAKKEEVEMSLPIEDWASLFPGLRLGGDFKLEGVNSPEKNDAVESAQVDFLDKAAMLRSIIKDHLVKVLMDDYKKNRKQSLLR